MSNEITHGNSLRDGEIAPLDSRPGRRSRKNLLPLFLLLLGVVILAGGGVVLVRLLNSHQPTASATPTSASKAGQHSLAQGCTSARIPINVVAQDAASGLNMTVDQVKAKVHAGKTFAQIATARSITAQQLRALEIRALQQANNYWLGLGCITQQDVTNNMQRDVGDTAYMDAEFTDVFR